VNHGVDGRNMQAGTRLIRSRESDDQRQMSAGNSLSLLTRQATSPGLY
jgi:hypothetical protein